MRQDPQPSPLLPSWNKETTYRPPTYYPHGLCIIINVKSFMKPRSVHDKVNLTCIRLTNILYHGRHLRLLSLQSDVTACFVVALPEMAKHLADFGLD